MSKYQWFHVHAGNMYCGVLRESADPDPRRRSAMFLPVWGGRLIGMAAYEKVSNYCQLRLERIPPETPVHEALHWT